MAAPLHTSITQAQPKEPVLPRRPRHRAPGTAERGVLGIGRHRHALAPRSRAAALLVLSAICGVLLVAAPIAILFAGFGGSGSQSEGTPGTSRDGGSGVGGQSVGGAVDGGGAAL